MSSIEHMKQHSVASLLRHERARMRAIKQKSLPVALALEIAEDEAEIDAESAPILPPGREDDTDLESDE